MLKKKPSQILGPDPRDLSLLICGGTQSTVICQYSPGDSNVLRLALEQLMWGLIPSVMGRCSRFEQRRGII